MSIPTEQLETLFTTTTNVLPLTHPIRPPAASRQNAAPRVASGNCKGASGWEAVRCCEHGGSYDVGGNPKYFGAYQFSQRTWNSTAERHGGSVIGTHEDGSPKYARELIGVNPGNASPAEQDQMAQWLYADSGRGQWPICGKYLP